MKYFCLLLFPVLVGCTSPLERNFQVVPSGPHDQGQDRSLCLDYAELNGVINLGPMMVDGMKDQPDRQRRDTLFVRCMEGKGYRFKPLREGGGESR